MAPILEIENLTKKFSRVVANDSVNLTVEKGEVRALLGENGAGKTTLMNCLYGLYGMDSGEIRINGAKVQINSAHDAIKNGIGMVSQHFMLVPKLTVTENVILGLKSPNEPWVDFKQAAKNVKELSDHYSFNIDPEARIQDLAVGMQQRVEILKLLYRESDLMIFDEPTAVLTPNEVEEFFEIIKKFKNEGRTIIFISHKLNEVMSICDNVTVMRDAKDVGNVAVSETSERELAKMMVGREIELAEAEEAKSTGDVVLDVEDLHVLGPQGLEAVKGISLQVRSGEILGIAGVDGNGQLELGDGICGLKKVEEGHVRISEQDVTNLTPDKLMSYGLSHIPPDRHRTGLILEYSVEDNLVSKEIAESEYSKYGVLRRANIREHANKLIGSFNIRGCGPATFARQVSGGNQQKIILAREFSRQPKLIVAVQPTRGLDISAIEFVREELIRQRDRGAAILLISTELEEILALSDRIEVIYEGAFTGSIKGHDVDPMDIGLQMAGQKRKSE